MRQERYSAGFHHNGWCGSRYAHVMFWFFFVVRRLRLTLHTLCHPVSSCVISVERWFSPVSIVLGVNGHARASEGAFCGESISPK